MSMPNIPDVNPTITIDRQQSINLLLASVAFEELGLSHMINAEAEKIQYVLGTLEGTTPPSVATIAEVIEVNSSAEKMMRNIIKNQMLLQFKLEDTIDILEDPATATTLLTNKPALTTANEVKE